jgi:biopolymer transport protein ExbD
MFKPKSNKYPEINVTPLVDVMLVLLVIFMVVSPTMHSEIDVKVPTIRYVNSVVNEKEKKGPIVIIQGAKIFVNGKETADHELKNELKKHSKEHEIFIKADESIAYKRVFEILDIVKSCSFYNIFLVGTVK